MKLKPQSIAPYIEFIGLIIFLAVYKFAPKENHVMYASIALLVTSFFQLGFYMYFKLHMPNHVLFINLLAIIFTIPAAIYNDLRFLRVKLLIIKGIFFGVPFLFLLFKKNFLYVFFREVPGIKELKPYQFDRVNLWYIVTAFISLLVTIWVCYKLNDDDFVYFKSIWLPVIGMIYIVPLVYYSFKNASELEKARKEQEEQEQAEKLQENQHVSSQEDLTRSHQNPEFTQKGEYKSHADEFANKNRK